MNFERAIHCIKSGHKVRRPSWDSESYWQIGKELGFIKVDWEHRKGSYKIEEVKE